MWIIWWYYQASGMWKDIYIIYHWGYKYKRTWSKWIKVPHWRYGLQNIIHEPTCFKVTNGTLLDSVLTTKPHHVASITNINTGISDFHHLVGFATEITVPKLKNSFVTYRSYKKCNESEFKLDVANAPYHVSDIFDGIEDKYWLYKTLTSSTPMHRLRKEKQ